ncbi:MAG: hypothetical protein K9N47_28940 [Prosthecobacter sp.]|uniref:hypothetical protein n=1 Tax=Prosthecobacter sp. TaxID=1965333 RepID=UPI002628DEAB|nr:hypothetical protein [Prosthecobacter sp.]MCF7790180.1 hypothetical protein [Prosthecobacter sp.]
MLPPMAFNAMKFFNYNTASAFGHPSVRGWLVVFVCGFLTVCIIGPVLCTAVWVIIKFIRLLPFFSPPDWHVTVLSTAGVIFKVAAVFGALLATVMVLEAARRKRQEARIPGHHPIIGDFEHSPFYKTWHAQPVLPTGKPVSLSAYGSGPSEAQATLWQQFIARYDELIATATESLLMEGHPLQGAEAITFTPSGITLTQDGLLHLGFEFATVPENFWESEADEPYPTASFTSALELKSTEWLRPYG